MVRDITNTLLGEKEIHTILLHIFSDSILVDRNFMMKAAGPRALAMLNLEASQIVDKNFRDLAGASFTDEQLPVLLKSGYFEDCRTALTNGRGDSFNISLSGFYLGIIADCDRYILLQFKYIEVLESDLDNFIYATSHSLRGPLATLKGLLNLMTLPGQIDHAFILEKMKQYADRLDDRLHKLIYFAEADKSEGLNDAPVTFEQIVNSLKAVGDQDLQLTNISFISTIPNVPCAIEHGSLIISLLQNVKAFFCRAGARNCEMQFYAQINESSYEFGLSVSNMVLTEEQERKINSANSGYKDILSHPEYTELYSAKKILLRLHGQINLRFEEQRLHIATVIPRSLH